MFRQLKQFTYYILIVTCLAIWTWPVEAESSIVVSPTSFQEQSVKGQSITKPLVITNTGLTPLHYGLQIDNLNYITYTPQTSAQGFPYVWTDIRTTGTHLKTVSTSDDGWEMIDLYFDFPFFQHTFRQVYVSTNGYLTLGAQGVSVEGDIVPSPVVPTNFIGGFAKDLNAMQYGDVYYQQDSDRLIVQYTNVPETTHYGFYTFQIILERNGNITMYYKEMGGSKYITLIGIQNDTKDIGISRPLADAGSGKAIQFQPKLLWMELGQLSGDVPPQSSVTVPVTFGAGLALERTYTANIVLEHNATNAVSPLTIPCTYTSTPLDFQIEQITSASGEYQWSDSSMMGGPEYVWKDIVAEGKPLNLYTYNHTSIDLISISFDFPFYNNKYNQIYIHEAGVISFGGTTNSNGEILNLPSAEAPENIVAGLLMPNSLWSKGHVYYLDDGQRVIIQYEDIHDIWNGVETTENRYTFQIVLEQDGTILLYYKTIIDPALKAIIGIQNQDKTRGLTVPYVKDGFAVRITNVPIWINPTQTTGTIAAGEQTEIPIVFAAQGFPTGTHTGELQITSNDPDAIRSDIACTLTILNAPPVPHITYTGLLSSGEPITFSGANSTDREGGIVVFAWDLNNDHIYDDATAPTVTHTFDRPGQYEVGLEIKDQDGVTNVSRIPVTIQNNAPKPVLTWTPQVPDLGTEVTFDASASSDLDGVITGFAWDLDHDQVYDDGFDSIVKHTFTTSGEYTIGLQLTDDYGAIATHTVTVSVHHWPKMTLNTDQVNLTTDPATAVDASVLITNTGGMDLTVQLTSDYEMQRRKGGPDTGGYYWTDSDLPGGVEFVWEDIRLTGQLVKRTATSAEYTINYILPFVFPYYGKPYYQICISPNGFLSMQSSALRENQSLPGSYPVNLIAAYFDDLDPIVGSSIYYLATADRFVVQYEEVKVKGLEDTVTFQIVLKPDGTITYYYKDMVGACNGATIGIQDHTREKGIQISLNQPFQKHNYAVRFETMQNWLTLSPGTGLIHPGESMEVRLVADPTGVRKGRNTADLIVTHNGNNAATPVTIPITLQVTNVGPSVTITQLSELTYVNEPVILVAEAQDRDGYITGYTWDVDGDGLDDGTGSNPHLCRTGAHEIQVQVTDDNGAIAIASLPITVRALPQIQVTPMNVVATIERPGFVHEILTIRNPGESDLHFEIVPFVVSEERADYVWKDSTQPDGPAFQWRDIRAIGTPLQIVSELPKRFQVVDLKFAFPFYGNKYYKMFVSPSGYVTLSEGSIKAFYDRLPNTNLPGSLIAPLFGGIYTSDGEGVYYLDDGDRVIIQFQRIPTYEGYVTYQIVLEESGRIYFYYKEIAKMPETVVGIQNSTKTKGIQVQYRDLNYIRSGLAVKIEPVDTWLNASPKMGVIPAGQSAEVQITIDSKNTAAGTHWGTLDILHHLPQIAPVQVLVNLTVTNKAPNAVIEYTPAIPLTNESISLRGTSSNDLDGTIVEYVWDLDGDFQYDDATGSTLSKTFDANGLYPIGLRVKDNDGDFATQTVMIEVANRLPTVTVRYSPSLAEVGQEVRLNASATDPDGTIVSYAWDLDQDGAFDDGVGAEIAYAFETVGEHTVRVQVTDDDGGMTIGSVPVLVKSWQKIVVEPATFHVTTGKNQIFQQTLTIENTGTENLTYSVGIFAEQIPTFVPRDQYGYYVTDSDVNEGLTYVWEDIARPETKLTQFTGRDDYSQLVNLPFAFRFYGVAYNSMYISLNGFVTFKTGSITWTNFPFPHVSSPANSIAPFFKDLRMGTDSGIYYSVDDQRVVVQYDKVRYGYANETYTFQMVLYPDGTIRFYYKAMGNVLDATVGMQNESKKDGLTVVHKSAYLKNEMAVQIQHVNWLTRAAASGTVLPGNKAEIVLQGNTQGKSNGQYHAIIGIQHNAQNAAQPFFVPFDLVVENLLPVATFTLPMSVYTNELFVLDASASTDPEGRITDYAWDLDGDGFDDGQGVTLTTSFLTNGIVTVRLQVTDDEGGTQIAERTLMVRNRPPEAILTGTTERPLLGTAVEFDLSQSRDLDGIIEQYAWDLDQDGDFDDALGVHASRTFDLPGDYRITGRVTDDDGDMATATWEVQVVNQNPTAEYTGLPRTANLGDTVIINASVSSDPEGYELTYAWDLDGDGVYDDGNTVEISTMLDLPGVRTIGLQVSDHLGAKASITHTIDVVNRKPTPRFVYTPEEPGTNETITLDASTSVDEDGTIESYQWDLDQDGAFDDATGVMVSRVFAKSGSYTMALQVTDQFGASAVQTVQIMVHNQAPEVRLTASKVAVHLNERVELNLCQSTDPDGIIEHYTWDLDGDGEYDDATGDTITHDFTVLGLYTLYGQVTDDEGASQSASVVIEVTNAVPEARITVAESVHLNQPVRWDGTNSVDLDGSIAHFAWDLDDDGEFDDATDAVVTRSYGKCGTYRVQLKVTDSFEAFHIQSASVTVVNDLPKAIMTVSYETPYQGQTITLSLIGSFDDGTIVSYSWDLDGDGNFGDETKDTILWRSETKGTYEIRAKVTDDCGGEAVVTRSIRVLNLSPFAACRIQPEVIYSDSTVTLDASEAYDSFGEIISYEWDLDQDLLFDDATGKTITTAFTQVGFYTVSLRVTDADGASGTKSMILCVHNTPPVAAIRFTPTNPHTFERITLNASESTDKENGIVDYAWDLNGDGTFGDQVGMEVTYSFPRSGQYTMGLKVRDIHDGVGFTTVTVNVLNQKPIAKIRADQLVIKTGESVQLDLRSSYDNDGRIVQYVWDLNQDGAYGDAMESSLAWSFDQEGTYTITGKVVDDEGAYDVGTITITVVGRIPTTVDLQSTPSNPYPGEEVTWNASCITDPDQPIVSYAWDLDQDGEYDDGGTESVTRTFMQPGSYLIKVRVTDVHGNWFFKETICRIQGVRMEEYSVKADLGQVNIYWYSPDPVISKVRLLRKTGGYSTTPADGMLIYEGNDRAIVDKDQTPGTYYYTIFPYDANDRTYPVPLEKIAIPASFPKETVRFQPGGSNPFANVVMAQNWQGDIYTEWNNDNILGKGNTGRTSDLWLYFPDLFGFGDGQIPMSTQIERAKLTLKIKQIPHSFTQPRSVKLYRITDPSGFGQPVIADKSGPFTGLSFLYRDGRPGQFIPWGSGAENIQSFLTGVNPIATWNISPDQPMAEMTFDLAEVVQAWAKGEPNHGLYITIDGSWDIGEQCTIYGPQAAVVTDRPLLEVVYNTLPEVTVPEEPIVARYTPWDGAAYLSWSELSGEAVGFRVVRNTERKPIDPYDGELVYDGSKNFCFDVGLVVGVTYNYGIFTYERNRVYSQGFPLTVTGGTLAAPYLESVNTGPGYVELRWTLVPGATGYALYRRDFYSGEVSKITTLSTEFRDYNVMSSLYDYGVTALNEFGESQRSGNATAVSPLPGEVKPMTPDLKVGQMTGSKVALSVDYPYGTTTAETVVERLVGEEWREVGRIPYTSNDLTDTGLLPNTLYEYRATSVNIAGTSGYTPSLTARTADELVFPGPFTWKVISATQVVLNWVDAPNEADYVIEIRKANGELVAIHFLNPNTTFFTVTGLSPAESYYCTVIARRGHEVKMWMSDLIKTYNDPKRDIF